MQFTELGLSDAVLRAVADVGYKQPTLIQRDAIPVIYAGRDVLGCAQTGTGKTASFTLPMIDILSQGRARARMPRSLILEPTRELATQVSENFERYGKYAKLTMALLIGGESMDEQMRVLNRGVDVLIATPGRLLDLFERGKILLSDVKILVIDEADRMLDMGFIPDVERIVGLLPAVHQTLFFSATMPLEIRRLADAFLTNPKEITVAPPASPADTVTQRLVVVAAEDKREALRRLIDSEDLKNALIFCNRKRDVDILCKSLGKHGYSVAALHGDMPQSKRTETLEAFRHDRVRLLVASDVAARGLDIAFLSHVFSFDVPINAEDYVHRIGRTGRAGREGRSFLLAAPEDGPGVAAIETLIGKAIPRAAVEGLSPVELDASGRRRRRSASSGTGASRSSAGRSSSGRSGSGRSGAPRSSGDRPSADLRDTKSGDTPQPRREAEAAADAPLPTPVRPTPARPTPARTGPRNEKRRKEGEPAGDAPLPVRSERHTRKRDGASEQAAPPADTARPRRKDEASDRPVVGLGDHVPAFLMRSFKVPPRKAEAVES